MIAPTLIFRKISGRRSGMEMSIGNSDLRSRYDHTIHARIILRDNNLAIQGLEINTVIISYDQMLVNVIRSWEDRSGRDPTIASTSTRSAAWNRCSH